VTEYQGVIRGADRRVAIIVSRFNDNVTSRLVAGARACLEEHGVAEVNVDVISVPGAWELPIAAGMIARRRRHAAIIALGCVIRGETPHFDFVAGPAANGLSLVAVNTGIPVTFGVLTTEDLPQALARAGGRHGNKGWDAALAALELADLNASVDATDA
jgi:6,7-dimethyl-8-ribityllumazine synthase